MLSLRSSRLLFGGLAITAVCVLGLPPVVAFAQEASVGAQAEVGGDDAMVLAPGGHGGEDGHAGHPAGHVDTDPTHANMLDGTYEVVDFRTDMAFFSAIVFLLLLAGLTAVAWKPIMQGLEKRERGIAENIARAERAASEATTRLSEYEAKLAAANEESQRILAEARKDAEAAGQKLVATAQEEAARQRDRAIAEIEAAKRVALGELATQSTDVAMSLAGRVVGREVRAEDHQGLIQEMLSKLPSQN